MKGINGVRVTMRMKTRQLRVTSYKLRIALLLGFNAGCVVAPMPADQLFGKGAGGEGPGLYFEGQGIKAKASSNTKWELHGKKNPATGEVTLDSILDSNAADPLKEYPGWIGAMGPAQQMNFQWALSAEQEKTRQLQLVTGLVDKLGAAIVPFLPQLIGHGAGMAAPGGAAPPPAATNPLDTLLAVWNSIPEAERSALLSRLMNGGASPAGAVGP